MLPTLCGKLKDLLEPPMSTQNQVAERNPESLADALPGKKPPTSKRRVKITYLGPTGQQQETIIRESAIPGFLRTRIQLCK